MIVRPWVTVDRAKLSALRGWLRDIPFDQWPQQHLLRGELRPAFVTSRDWHGFGERTDSLVEDLIACTCTPTGPLGVRARERNRWMSVVMPGHAIDVHADPQPAEWQRRVHVPIATNERAIFLTDDGPTVMREGFAYLVDVSKEHGVWNAGRTPRIHLMFDLVA